MTGVTGVVASPAMTIPRTCNVSSRIVLKALYLVLHDKKSEL